MIFPSTRVCNIIRFHYRWKIIKFPSLSNPDLHDVCFEGCVVCEGLLAERTRRDDDLLLLLLAGLEPRGRGAVRRRRRRLGDVGLRCKKRGKGEKMSKKGNETNHAFGRRLFLLHSNSAAAAAACLVSNSLPPSSTVQSPPYDCLTVSPFPLQIAVQRKSRLCPPPSLSLLLINCNYLFEILKTAAKTMMTTAPATPRSTTSAAMAAMGGASEDGETDGRSN